MKYVYENLFHEVYLHIKVNTDEGFGDETAALFTNQFGILCLTPTHSPRRLEKIADTQKIGSQKRSIPSSLHDNICE